MAEALRRAAVAARLAEERRREQLRLAAEKRFLESAAALEKQWKALCDAGFEAVAGYALAELGRQRGGLAQLQASDIDGLRQAAEERDALLAHAVQTLRSLGERGRAGAVAAMPRVQSDEDLRAALAQSLSAGSAVESYLAVLKRARDGMAFLEACEAAQVSWGDDVERARTEVGRFLARPTLEAATRTERAIADLRPASLEERLHVRRQALMRGLDTWNKPDRRPLLEAWRPGFAESLSALRQALTRGDWLSAAPALRELERFVDARAEQRVRLVMAAARARGFEVVEPERQASHWVTSISDEHGEKFALSEAIAQSLEQGDVDTTLEFLGPQNFDGPACMDGGLHQIAEQLRTQGVELRIFDEGRELTLARAPREASGRTPAATLGPTAAPVRPRPKLQQ
ncbi:MAG: hypothetical protein JNN03_00880 [Rubrivivax sp.]|nr:hypothetical protein [Rubrivivax sp.]